MYHAGCPFIIKYKDAHKKSLYLEKEGHTAQIQTLKSKQIAQQK